MNRALVVLAALALDAALGEPPGAWHPVAWMGSAIARGRAWALRGDRLAQLVRGALVALAIPAGSAALAHGLVRALDPWPVVGTIATALALKPMFAVRALRDAAFRVRDALDRGDVAAARVALGSLCSRSADRLEPPALVAATVESVAENTSDSVVAPLLFFACFGLPGAVFYRAANTLDAMMGYHGELEWAGKAGARLDDLLNLVPARVTAMLLVLAGFVTGADARCGIATWRRDGSRTESPNAGRPMAAMAGLLGVCLEKEGHYRLGDARRELSAGTITSAWRIAALASLGAAAAAAAAARVIHGA